MDRKDVITHLKQWAYSLTKPQQALGNLPICPYAKGALDNQQILIHFASNHSFQEALHHCIQNWTGKNELEIVVIEGAIGVKKLHTACRKLFLERYKALDFFLLASHPDRPVTIGSVPTRSPLLPLIMVQRLSRVVDASHSLAKSKYYEYWEAATLNEIVRLREL